MGNMISFGAQYYRAPTPQPDQWEKDLRHMKNIGFNTIKIWAQWRWNNPEENKYDFSDLDRLMDLAAQNGLLVIINVILDVAPAWFYRRYPDSVMIAANGRRLEPQTTGYRQIGGAPGPCYHHMDGIHSRELFIRELACRYKDHPALYIWDLWNEPELTCGIAREPDQESMVCYCDQSIIAFRSWLQVKYKTLDLLNKHWNRNYISWDDVEAPRNPHTFQDMIDWRTFFAETLTSELSIRVKAVKEFDLVHPVMVHTVPMPYFNMVNACSDDYALAKLCDIFGNSIGSHPFAAALSTSCAEGKPVINSEIHALGGSTFNRPNIPTFEEMKKHIMIPLARGIKGFLFWQYRPETLGTESPAWGLTALDGGNTVWLDYSVRINEVLQKYASVFSGARPLDAPVAIINSNQNQIFDWCVTNSIDLHYESVAGVYMALYRMNYNADILHTDQLTKERIARYKVLYYPFPYYMEKSVADVLKEWVNEGGTLISEAFFGGLKAEDGLHSTHMPGYGFDEIFSVDESAALSASTFLNAYGKEWSQEDPDRNSIPLAIAKELKYLKVGDSANGYFFCEELQPKGAEVLARFPDGQAAVSCSRYGKGKAVLAGTLLGCRYYKQEDETAAHLIASLAEVGQAGRYFEVDQPNVRADILTHEENCVLIVVSENAQACALRITVNLPLRGKTKAINMMTDEVVPLQGEPSRSYIQLELEPKSCEIFLLS